MEKNLNLFIGMILLASLLVIFGHKAEAKYYQKGNSNEPSFGGRAAKPKNSFDVR